MALSSSHDRGRGVERINEGYLLTWSHTAGYSSVLVSLFCLKYALLLAWSRIQTSVFQHDKKSKAAVTNQ